MFWVWGCDYPDERTMEPAKGPLFGLQLTGTLLRDENGEEIAWLDSHHRWVFQGDEDGSGWSDIVIAEQNPAAVAPLREISVLIDEGQYDLARQKIEQVRPLLRGDEAEVIRAETLMAFMEADIDPEPEPQEAGMTNDEAIRELREAHASLADLWECSWDDDTPIHGEGCIDSSPCTVHADLDRLYEAIVTVERALGRKE